MSLSGRILFVLLYACVFVCAINTSLMGSCFVCNFCLHITTEKRNDEKSMLLNVNIYLSVEFLLIRSYVCTSS